MNGLIMLRFCYYFRDIMGIVVEKTFYYLFVNRRMNQILRGIKT